MASLTPQLTGVVDASETKQEQERTGFLAAAAKRHFRGAGARLSVSPSSETCEWILFGCSAQRKQWRKVMMGIRFDFEWARGSTTPLARWLLGDCTGRGGRR
jgi:hypothetical protein